MQHRAVTEALTRRRRGGIHERLHFLLREVWHQPRVAPLARTLEDAAILITVRRYALLEKPEEGSDGGQTDVARRRSIAARRLELLKKRADERRVELLEGEGARRRLQSLRGELEERAKAVRVRVARVQTGAAVAHEVLAEERFDVRRQRGHTCPPLTNR